MATDLASVLKETSSNLKHAAEEEVPVCRICLVELDYEDEEAFKMECFCKGDLALAHKECALKWFKIRRGTTCDICGSQIQNLPKSMSTPQQDSKQLEDYWIGDDPYYHNDDHDDGSDDEECSDEFDAAYNSSFILRVLMHASTFLLETHSRFKMLSMLAQSSSSLG